MKVYTESDVRKVLKAKFAERNGKTQTQKAAEMGVSIGYVYQVLSGSKPLTSVIAKALGFVEREQPRTFVRNRSSMGAEG